MSSRWSGFRIPSRAALQLVYINADQVPVDSKGLMVHCQYSLSPQPLLNTLLKPVKECADVVNRINELADLRDREQHALPNPNIKLPPEEAEQVTRRKQQIDDCQKEIDTLYKPFPGTEREIYSFLGDLQNVLNALPVEPPIRTCRS